MHIDIVLPDGNEDAMIRMAERLGYSGLCLAYPYARFSKPDPGRFNTKLQLYHGIIVAAKDVAKARNKADLVIVRESENIREAVERFRPDIIIDAEQQPKRDYMHQRNAGLNQVICRIANQKDVSFGISFSAILQSRHRGQLMGRLMQNIALYRKFGSSVVAGSFAATPYEMRAPKDLESLLIVLGMESKQAKKALSCVGNIISRNQKIRSKGSVGGIEVVGDA